MNYGVKATKRSSKSNIDVFPYVVSATDHPPEVRFEWEPNLSISHRKLWNCNTTTHSTASSRSRGLETQKEISNTMDFKKGELNGWL